MDHFGKISIGFSLEGSRRLARIVRGLVIGILVARHLGPELYGTYAYALSIAFLLGSFIPFGLDGILTREFTQCCRSPGQLLKMGILGRLIGASALIVGVPIYLVIAQPSMTIVLVLLMGCLDRLALVPRVREFQFQALGQFGVIARCDITATILGAAFAIIGILLDWPIWVFALAVAIDSISYATLLWISRPRIPKTIPSNPPPHFKKMTTEALPYLLAGASSMAFMEMGVILLRNLQGDYEAGIFQSALRVLGAGFMILYALYGVLLPRIQTYSEEEFKEKLQSSAKLMGRLALVLLLLSLIVGVPLYPLVLGEAFREGRFVFACLTPALCFMGIKLIADSLIIREKAGWVVFTLNVSAAVVNLLLNLALIPLIGMYGAVIALIAAYAVSGLGITLTRQFSWTRGLVFKALVGR